MNLVSLLRIMFLRGSPERILYDRRWFILGLVAAIVLSALVQLIYFGDTAIFAGLRVFAELTMFMLWITLLTAKVGRLRLAQAMLMLVWISVVADAVLLLLGLLGLSLPIAPRDVIAVLWAAVVCYGVVNVIGWARREAMPAAALQVLGYVVAVVVLDGTFRYLFGIMAAA